MAPRITLNDLTGVPEIERLARGEGQWLTEVELQQRADEISIAFFGIRKMDTFSRETAPSSLGGPEWSRAMLRPDSWEEPFRVLYFDDGSWDERPDACWAIDDYVDGADEHGDQLRCFHLFARQIVAVVHQLMPAAKFMPDGSGGRSTGVGAEAWGAALEREAREFKPSRRR